MLLVDALYINNSGGKVLLEYLIRELKKRQINCFFLLDHRLETDLMDKGDKFLYLKATLFNRYNFYVQNKTSFSKVFCFGNLGPPIQLNIETITYVHQKLFLSKLPETKNLKHALKTILFKYFLKRTDLVLVQSNLMEKDLNKFINKSNLPFKTQVVPFYDSLIGEECKKAPFFYLYVSTGFDYKNHMRLLDGFSAFYKRHNKGELHLTVSKDFSEVNNYINKLVKKGYPIVNHGFINKEKLKPLYAKASFIVYPSLVESLGLGLVEGIDNNCKIIAANLNYVFEVCDPSITFNPFNSSSIEKAFIRSLDINLKDSRKLMFNEINNLLEILN